MERLNEKETIKNFKEAIKGAKSCIFITNNGMEVYGNTPEIMTMIQMMLKELEKRGMPKELMKEAIEMAFMDENELIRKLKKELGEFINRAEEMIKE